MSKDSSRNSVSTGDAYMQGEEARSLGYRKKENPFLDNEEEGLLFDAWAAGWKAESKRGYL